MPYAADQLLQSDLYSRLVEIRRDLHLHPELSWRERRTSQRICEFLHALDIPFRNGVAMTGVVADIPGTTDGPRVALRADMDALPIIEETGLPFQSEVPGVMHACGHDGHTAMLLGAAALLAENKPPLPVRLLFQPAEETGEGAKAMIEQGALDGVDMIFGGHVDRHFPVGTIAVTDGAVNASSDRFSVKITGKGGHAARPHETIDAVVVGSLMVMALQTIVSREINPAHPSAVTVGRFDAGTAPNVIAGQATLEGSIRAQDQNVRESLQNSIERVATSLGQLHGAEVEVEISLGTPVVSNSPSSPRSRVARRPTRSAPTTRSKWKQPTWEGEDFGYFLNEIPGCYVRFGTSRADEMMYPAHSSKFDFDEAAVAVGAAYYRAVVDAVAATR